MMRSIGDQVETMISNVQQLPILCPPKYQRCNLFTCSRQCYMLISPTHAASPRPSFSMACWYRGPPLSLLRKCFSSFCLRCTSSLRLRLLCLSLCPHNLVCSASLSIFVVRIATCTSDEPVSGPARTRGKGGGGVASWAGPMGLGGNVVSVRCRPNSSMHR